jgi:hypothetical protein
MRRRLRTFAMLDTIVAPSARSFEWHPRWNKHEQVGAFRDGEGNYFFAWFGRRGALVRGFDHESRMSPFRKDPPEIWPGMFDGVPKSLASGMSDPTFAVAETTFCFWSAGRRGHWTSAPTQAEQAGDDADGAASLLGCFGRDVRTWASVYYGIALDARALARLLWGETLDWETLETLNVDFDERAVREEAELLDWTVDLSHRGDGASNVVAPIRLERSSESESSEFVVRRGPRGVLLCVGDRTVAVSPDDVYGELFDLVRSRLEGG